MDDRVRDYVNGLPDASGTFTGTFSTDADLAGLFGPVPDLIPVEIDTYDQPNSAADLVPGQYLNISAGAEGWSMRVDHVEPLSGNVVRVWCHLPVQAHSVE
jgi:hypothetical protein